MPSTGSITYLLDRLKEGDGDAIEKIWREYYPRLVALARIKLRDMPRRVADEEDAALSAFDSFCRAAEQGQFPRLENRDNLWQLLVTITVRKALDLRVAHGRKKRGSGLVRGDSALIAPGVGSDEGWAQIMGHAVTPEIAAQAAEEYKRLLGQLLDDEFRSIAVWKMEGLTNAEIAQRLGCAISSVERRLRIIRKTWEAECATNPEPIVKTENP